MNAMQPHEKNHALEQANDQMRSVREMVAHLKLDREDAEQRIIEDALSVEVCGASRQPHREAENEEFRIVLCTGGPHVQIRGEIEATVYCDASDAAYAADSIADSAAERQREIEAEYWADEQN